MSSSLRERRRNVTFPARQYSVNGERRRFALLRPIDDVAAQARIRDLILEAYARARGKRCVARQHTETGRPPGAASFTVFARLSLGALSLFGFDSGVEAVMPFTRPEASRFYDEWMAEQCLLSVNVECYAGHRGEQTPRTLILDDRRVVVAEVVDAWLAPDYRYFKLKGEDGDTYLVRHDERSNTWELTMFRAERVGGR